MKTMDALQNHAKVDAVDDERAIGNGVIVTLKKGWTFSAGQDNRVSGEDTPSRALQAVRASKAFAGPYED